MAAMWHVLAAFEYHTRIEFKVVAWHLVAVQALYWTPFLLYRSRRLTKLSKPDEVNRVNMHSLLFLALCILIVSVVRTYTVVMTMPGE